MGPTAPTPSASTPAAPTPAAPPAGPATPLAPTPATPALGPRLVAFASALRGHGAVVGTSDVIDAGGVIAVLGLAERERLREGLAAALLRRGGHRPIFDDLFDVYFPAAVGARMTTATHLVRAEASPEPGHLGEAGRIPWDTPDPRTPAERRELAAALRAELEAALATGDERLLAALAARVVDLLGRLPNHSTLGGFSAAQALDALAPQTAIAGAHALVAAATAADAGGAGANGPGNEPGNGTGPGNGGGSGPGGGPRFADRFARDEVRDQVAAFRRSVEVETRRRNAEIRGVERIGRYAVRTPAEFTSFVLAGPAELAELRRTITPLARKLATRLAARRRLGRGAPIDIRRTLRRSMATGGVPMRPAYQRRARTRIDLVLVCDMSSSVAGFSRFTILLMQALAAQFRRVRIFGFVNVVDELTDIITAAPPGADLADAFNDVARMTRWHRNSDYGSALQDFAQHHLDAIGHRSVVLILGDARTNHTDPGLPALHAIAERARSVVWLNPEPERQWDSGDSVARRYAEVVDMYECRNLHQLRHFVTRLLPI